MNRKDLEAVFSLNQWGVPFLSSPIPCENPKRLDPAELVLRLIQSSHPRLHLGVTAFFLVHSEKAPSVLQSLALLDQKSSLRLKYYYTAAAYLQRFWKSQLTFNPSLLPDYFSKEQGLPVPTALNARLGLLAIEEALQKEMNEPYNYLARFEALARLLQQQGGLDATAGFS